MKKGVCEEVLDSYEGDLQRTVSQHEILAVLSAAVDNEEGDEVVLVGTLYTVMDWGGRLVDCYFLTWPQPGW